MAAWTYFFHKTKPLTWGHDDPYGYACMSIKAELIYNGFSKGVDPTSQVLGTQADEAIRAFQKANGLTADGVVGPNTARVLYRKRAKEAQATYDIPNDYLCKIKSLESANDPAAIGFVDPADHGLYQINLKYHPDVTLEQTEDGEFATDFAGRLLSGAYSNIKDWEGAVVSWNIGSYWATQWVKNGKPANGNSFYSTATSYLENIKKQSC